MISANDFSLYNILNSNNHHEKSAYVVCVKLHSIGKHCFAKTYNFASYISISYYTRSVDEHKKCDDDRSILANAIRLFYLSAFVMWETLRLAQVESQESEIATGNSFIPGSVRRKPIDTRRIYYLPRAGPLYLTIYIKIV